MRIRRAFAIIALMTAPHIVMSQVRSVQSGRAGATLATLGAMTVTPMATFGSRSYVARTVTLTAAVTNPDAMGTTGWCEMTFDASRDAWSKNGGTYAKGTCTFANVQLPPPRRAPLDLNVRACNAAGCKESPTPLVAEVDIVAPTVLAPLTRPGIGAGATIEFSEFLPAAQQQRIEAALSTAADHPLKFIWSEHRPTGGRNDLTIQSASAPATLRQSVSLDLTDGVGNVTPGAKLVEVKAQSVALPDLAAVVVTPSATVGGRTTVGRVVTLTAVVSNPEAIEKAGGECQMARDKRGSWTPAGGVFAKGVCTFSQIDLHPGQRLVPVELNVRGCNPAGCKESPVWINAEADAIAPTVINLLRKGGVDANGADTITFSEPLAPDQQQRIQAAIAASADRPVQFSWPAGNAPIGSRLVIRGGSMAAHFRQNVTLDLTDPVGNVTPGARILEVPQQAAELPNLGPITASPMGTVGANVVPRTVTLSAAVTNPAVMGTTGTCEAQMDARQWSSVGGTYANGTCTFRNFIPPGVRSGTALTLRVRACAASGCKEAPASIVARLDDEPPTVVTAIKTKDVGTGLTLVISEPLPPDQKQRVESAISAAADHPVKFAWSVVMGPGGPTEHVVVTSVAAPAHLTQSVSVDIADQVGNVTHAARVVSLP